MPILSVIIPTHNRSRYALPTIQAILSLSHELELVVSDSSAVDEIGPHSSSFVGHERLVLVRPPAGASVVDNFNFALEHATGDYLIFIGDDDLVTTQAIELARWGRENRVDSFYFSFPVSYYWPDFYHRLRKEFYASTVQIRPFANIAKPHDAGQALENAAKQFGMGVFEMPRAYSGMISRDLSIRIVEKYGALFGGVSPDIYSAALISAESKRCIAIDSPVVVPGNSGASTAGQSARGDHVGKLRENDHIGAFANLRWAPLIPEFYSVPTVWSYSLLKAIEQLDNKPFINFMRLYVRCLTFHRAYWRETMRSMASYFYMVGLPRGVVQLLRAFFQEALWVSHKAFSMLVVTVRGKPAANLQDLSNTLFASRAIEEELRRRSTLSKLSAALANVLPRN